MLTPSQRRYIRRKSRAAEPSRAELEGELNIVPLLDVVINLILFLLLTTSAALASQQVSAQLPTHGPPTHQPPTWRPTVHLGASGITVADAAGTYASGCAERGAVPTLPDVGAERDWLALRTCAERLVADHPGSDGTLVLSADATVPLQEVITAMDTVRSAGSRPLFPEVRIAAGLR